MQIQFIKKDKVDENIYTFWFKPAKQIYYQAGQFAVFHINHQSDKRGDTREFTLSSSPSESLIGITTNIGPKSSSFKTNLADLKPDTFINMDSPMGDFVLPINQSIPLVFIAKDMGVTPFRSILRYLSDTKEQRDITLIQQSSLKTPLFSGLFSNFRVAYKTVTESAEFSDKFKEVSASTVNVYYICGPTKFVDSIDKLLLNLGVGSENIITDKFIGYK